MPSYHLYKANAGNDILSYALINPEQWKVLIDHEIIKNAMKNDMRVTIKYADGIDDVVYLQTEESRRALAHADKIIYDTDRFIENDLKTFSAVLGGALALYSTYQATDGKINDRFVILLGANGIIALTEFSPLIVIRAVRSDARLEFQRCQPNGAGNICTFVWRTGSDSAGRYNITFTAGDGYDVVEQPVAINIYRVMCSANNDCGQPTLSGASYCSNDKKAVYQKVSMPRCSLAGSPLSSCTSRVVQYPLGICRRGCSSGKCREWTAAVLQNKIQKLLRLLGA